MRKTIASFIFDVGQQSSKTNSGVLLKSQMRKQLAEKTMKIPPASPFLGCIYDPIPYFLVSDKIFPLKTYLMKSCLSSQLNKEQSVYNYSHSR